jgi:hypothetical protein
MLLSALPRSAFFDNSRTLRNHLCLHDTFVPMHADAILFLPCSMWYVREGSWSVELYGFCRVRSLLAEGRLMSIFLWCYPLHYFFPV